MGRISSWTKEHLTQKQMTLLLAFAIGLLASVAAYLLHALIRQIQTLLTEGFSSNTYNWLYLVFPAIGIYLTSLLVRYVIRDNISHGITRILYAISQKRSHIKSHNCWSSVLSSAITIGFGGSVGAEAPIVLTGSAIGSTLGQRFGMDNKTLLVQVGCGASAAIAGIFKAPIAGLVFTLEVLMVDLTMASLLPILLSSVTATCFTYILMGSDSLFTFQLDSSFVVRRVPACIFLGLFCGLVSLYFIRSMSACEGMFAKLKKRHHGNFYVGASLLSLLIFVFPVLYGEGYAALNVLINGKGPEDWNALLNNSLFYGHSEWLLLYVALVIIFKSVATSATNGGGGVGGTFAPSLFIGGFTGFLFARLWNIYVPAPMVPEKNFTLLGMAGVMAGVMHAPLTGIFLIAEITGGYDLFLPLIIVSVCAVITISLFEPHSIYATRLAREGKLLTHHTDHSVLTLMSLESVIEKDFTRVEAEMTLGQLVNAISKSETSFLPVLDNVGRLMGEIDITSIRQIMFRTELYHRFTVDQIMQPVSVALGQGEPMEDVMRKFETNHSNYLPVVDVNNVLLGYVSRAHVYSLYRKMVADFSAE